MLVKAKASIVITSLYKLFLFNSYSALTCSFIKKQKKKKKDKKKSTLLLWKLLLVLLDIFNLCLTFFRASPLQENENKANKEKLDQVKISFKNRPKSYALIKLSFFTQITLLTHSLFFFCFLFRSLSLSLSLSLSPAFSNLQASNINTILKNTLIEFVRCSLFHLTLYTVLTHIDR